MARKKLQVGDPGKQCNSSIRTSLLWWVTALAAWCVSVANAEVYVIMFNEQAVAQQYASLGVEELDVDAQHDGLLTSWLGMANNFRKLHDYSRVFSGVAVDLTDSQVALMQSNEGVWRVMRDEVVHISTTHTPDYLQLPSGAWAKSGGVDNAGEGIVIGVVDTGIYPDHPSFADDPGKPYGALVSFKGACGSDARVPNGFCNGKIVGAQHFFAAAIAANPANSSDPDMSSPLDSNGHGSHCAGTAAGNHGVPVIVHNQSFGNASGMAPRARIAVYKALNAKGMGTTADIVAAIEQGIVDGVNVLSLSLGSSQAPANVTYTEAIALACLGALKAGVICVHAAGNTGPGPSTVTSFSPWLTSVGATTTDRIYLSYLFTGDGKNYTGQGLTPPSPGAASYPLISASDAIVVGGVKDPNFDCAEPSILNSVLIQGKILVCSWNGVQDTLSGSLSISNVSRTAAETSGAVGVVLLIAIEYLETNSPGSWNFNDFPAIAIWGPASYQSFKTYYAAANQNAAGAIGWLSGGDTAVYSGAPPKIAPFSSRGPDIYYGGGNPSPSAQPVADVLKPNIVAPGVDIWSPWSPLSVERPADFQGEKWSMISGTSMSAPHISGVSAIIKQMHPTWSPSAIASALSTTAIPVDSNNNTLVAYDVVLDPYGQVVQQFKRPGNAFDFGNGFVDANAALDPGLIFDATYADYIKFLCADKSLGSASVYAATSETCPVNPGLPSDLNLPSITVGNLTISRVVPRTVTNVGLLETYTAYIIKPAGVEVTVVPATFTIAPAATQPLNVTLTALTNSIYLNQTSFGRIYLLGSSGHTVQVPVTVTYKQV